MTVNCNGQILDLARPVVMGILNTTPDSFFDGGRYTDPTDALRHAEKMLREGATVVDIGGASSRPGAAEVSEAAELQRSIPLIEAICKHFPGTVISIDTWRARVAQLAIEAGAGIVNDISAGKWMPGCTPCSPPAFHRGRLPTF